MRVAILGAGAMGSWFGGRLAETGTDTQLLTTNEAHRDAIVKNGLTLQTGEGQSTVKVPALLPADVQGPLDLIILLTKSFQSKAALTAVAHHISDVTHVLTLQNGLGNSDRVAEFVPTERILVGVSMMPVDKIAPGVVKKMGDGPTSFNSTVAGDLPIQKKITDAFIDTDINLFHDAGIHQKIWEKVAFNAGMNALCALAHGTPGNIGATEGAMALVKEVALEVAEVGAGHGVVLDMVNVYSNIELACSKHKNHKPSMLQDLLAGKRTEVDALNGAVVEQAKRVGIEAPMNSMLKTMILLAENSHSSQSHA